MILVYALCALAGLLAAATGGVLVFQTGLWAWLGLSLTGLVVTAVFAVCFVGKASVMGAAQAGY